MNLFVSILLFDEVQFEVYAICLQACSKRDLLDTANQFAQEKLKHIIYRVQFVARVLSVVRRTKICNC